MHLWYLSPIFCGIRKIQPGSFTHSLGPSLLHHPWTHPHCSVCSLATLEVIGGLGSDIVINIVSLHTSLLHCWAFLLSVHLVVFLRFSCWLYQFDMVKLVITLKVPFYSFAHENLFFCYKSNIWSL